MTTGRDRHRSRISWTAERLRAFIAESFDGESIVVLANREPFRHERAADGTITVKRSGGGLVTALEPMVQACSGVWVAHGSGSADRAVVDDRDRIPVPAVRPSYRLRRVWLDADEERGYYAGFANEGLWPLCHQTSVLPIFRVSDFATYSAVNARFARAVCQEASGSRPLVLVQDYHFALAPQLIRRSLPSSTIVSFWHAPWPHPRDYAKCPWGARLLEGLLGSSIVGFQTVGDCRHFLRTVECTLAVPVDFGGQVITYRGRQVAVRAYPVSVEWPSSRMQLSPSVAACRADVRWQLGLPADIGLVVGVDRLDYTKGLVEKVRVMERLLESRPEFRERIVLVQVAEPSRTSLAAYQEYAARLAEETRRVNARFGTATYRPIILIDERREPADIKRLLRAADVCYVGSLHDGMNLVAKEFAAARDDLRGVLILSAHAGAARELTSALIVDPRRVEDCAWAIMRAVRMSSREQAARMRVMRAVVSRFNTYRWAGEMLTDAAGLRDRAPSAPPESVATARPDRLSA